MSNTFVKLNLSQELSFELKYGIQNNILHLDVPIENSENTLTVNFEIIDILGNSGFDIKKIFVSNKISDKANILQLRNKNKSHLQGSL